MKTRKSLVVYFSVVALLVVMCYGLKTTFAYFIANEQGTATNIKVAKLTYKLESESLVDNALTLKPNEVKKINIVLTNEYDIATIYRLNYIGNVTVEKSSSSPDEVKNIIDSKESKSIDLVIANNSDEEQTVIFTSDGGYIGTELEDGNILNTFDETLLQNKLLIDGTLTLTEENEYRDLTGVNNYIKVDEKIYRVLGVFKEGDNSYLKIIENESIGKHIIGENNNFLTTSLNTYLNVEYKESLNKLLKDNLKEVTYYTAGLAEVLEEKNNEETEENKEEILTYYDYERGEIISDETFNTSGISTIGLMYLSDYEYANSWLNKKYNEITIVPNTSDKETFFCINYREEIKKELTENGIEKEITVPINEISSCKVTDEIDVRPVMYLENNLTIESGHGTEEEPYIIIEDTKE